MRQEHITSKQENNLNQRGMVYSATLAQSALSLRSNFAWTIFGNGVYACCQWAILSVIAKCGTTEMLGQFALAVAVATPVTFLFHLNLRAVLVTDVYEQYLFGDYLVVRWVTTICSLATIAVASRLAGYNGKIVFLILLVGAGQAVENVSDIYQGTMQQHERMDHIATSQVLRGMLSVLAMAIVLRTTGSLLWGTVGLALARIVVLFTYDARYGTYGMISSNADSYPKLSTREYLSRKGANAAHILWIALPLGIVLMLGSLTGSIPRYFIYRHVGIAELGVYAAMASLVTVGSTVTNALGQTTTPRLAKLYGSGDLLGFSTTVVKLLGAGILVGTFCVLGALCIGRQVMEVIFLREYSRHLDLLVWMMITGSIAYLASLLGYVNTAARAFKPQLPLLAVVAGTCAVTNMWFVPLRGVWGAVVALLISTILSLFGQMVLLWHVLRALRRHAKTSSRTVSSGISALFQPY